jgi:hypothetical protein
MYGYQIQVVFRSFPDIRLVVLGIKIPFGTRKCNLAAKNRFGILNTHFKEFPGP